MVDLKMNAALDDAFLSDVTGGVGGFSEYTTVQVGVCRDCGYVCEITYQTGNYVDKNEAVRQAKQDMKEHIKNSGGRCKSFQLR